MGDSANIAATLRPPYYAVIFTSIRTDVDDGYDGVAERMEQLASEQPGFLGMETARENGIGITVSYWQSTDAIAAWKRDVEHRAAQRTGREKWYASFRIRVARVERDYGFDA